MERKSIVNQLINFLETVCIVEVAEALSVGNKKRRKGCYLPVMAVNAVLAWGGCVPGWEKTALLAEYVLIFLYIVKSHTFRLRKFDAYLYVFFSVLTVSVLKVVFFLPVSLAAGGKEGAASHALAMSALLTLCCCFIRKKDLLLNVRKGLRYWSRRSYIFAAVFCLLFIAQNLLFKSGKTVSFTDGFYIVCFAGAFGGFVYKLSTSGLELHLHRQYMEKYVEAIRDLRFRQHKFSNQLNAICLLSELYDTYDELVRKQKEEMEALRRYLMPNQLLALGNPMVIAHIYGKICQAEENGIALELQIRCSLESVAVPDIYLIEIIGNLLDNAMEEVMERGRREEIILSVFPDMDKCCISVSNEHDRISFDEYSHFCDPDFSRRGEGRGQGLPYIRKIVKRYGGTIQIGNIALKKKNYFMVCVHI